MGENENGTPPKKQHGTAFKVVRVVIIAILVYCIFTVALSGIIIASCSCHRANYIKTSGYFEYVVDTDSDNCGSKYVSIAGLHPKDVNRK